MFFTDVAGQSFAVLTVFNRFFRAAADTRHTMGAMIFPGWLPITHMDIVQGAYIHAFAAGNTFTGSVEFLGMHKQWIKQSVYDAAA